MTKLHTDSTCRLISCHAREIKSCISELTKIRYLNVCVFINKSLIINMSFPSRKDILQNKYSIHALICFVKSSVQNDISATQSSNASGLALWPTTAHPTALISAAPYGAKSQSSCINCREDFQGRLWDLSWTGAITPRVNSIWWPTPGSSITVTRPEKTKLHSKTQLNIHLNLVFIKPCWTIKNFWFQGIFFIFELFLI